MQTTPKCRVLLVNNDTLIREVVEEILKTLGYKVTCAKDGTEALNLFQDGEGIKIVVTNIIMPGMDGWQLAHQIKSIKPAIPIVAITGASPDVVVPKINSKSIEYALFNPLKINQLKETLRKVENTVH